MLEEEGAGWRLARDSSKGHYPFVIGGDKWAVEITQSEWVSLGRIIFDLIKEHKKLKNQLLPDESICLELDRSPWWGCLDGDKNSWSLQLILDGEVEETRSFEVFWPKPAAMNIAKAMRKLWNFSE